MVTCGVIVLVAVVIPEKLPGKWHWGVLQYVPVELTGEVYVGEPEKRYGTTVKSSPDGYWTITSLDPVSLAPLMEVLARWTTYPKPAIYRLKLESWLITEDDMLLMGHC